MKVLLMPLILLLSLYAKAQECNNYLFLQNGKTIEMSIYNKKGEVNGKQVYKVSNYQNSGGTVTATINSEMFDKNGKTINSATNSVKCTRGVMLMDMKMSMPGDQSKNMTVDATAQSFYLEYPANMSVGDALKEGHMEMDMDMNNGIKSHVTMDVTGRKVEGKEPVTTTAGTWDCFKITSHTRMVIKIGIGIPMNMDVTEWFAPGVGIIKTQSKAGGTAITAIN